MPSAMRRPNLDQVEAAALAGRWYGLVGEVRELPSERDRNFRISGPGGAEFVLKIANASEREELLACQSEVLARLSNEWGNETSPFPSVLRNRDGDELTRIDHGGETLLARLLTHLPGVPLARFRPHGDDLLQQLGRLLGRLDLVLRDFDHPELHRDLHWDLANAGQCFARHGEAFEDPDRLALASYFADLFEREAAPRLVDAPRSPIHGDANDYNVLVDVAGPLSTPSLSLIDFGDMVHSCTVGDLAVAAAYAMLDKADPLSAASAVVTGYHEVRPLSELEVELVFPLICTRLCMSATLAAEQRRAAPDNEYLSVSEQPVWVALGQLAQLHPRYAHHALRRACGWSPSPVAGRVRHWLAEHGADAAPVLPVDLARSVVEFDLGVGSLEPIPASLDAEVLSAQVADRIRAAGARLGIGRYDEARLIYTDDRFRTHEGDDTSRRTIHLGVDLFAPAGTPLAAPLDGVVHGAADNTGELDYGPTIVLEHQVDDGLCFYTLYGHLSRDSLEGMVEGRRVARGETVARIGAPPENGNWPPHLHFQVITDMLDKSTDYPGVADPAQREIWLDLCPDPSALLGLSTPASARAVSERELLERRRERLGASLSVAYRRPLHIVRGSGAHLYDAEARGYLDCVNNVCHVGHAHPTVVAAAASQMAVLNTNTRYLHENVVRYAERLTGLFPDPLSVCFFVCSGSEANELALRMARTHTGARDVVVVEGAYHGNTSALIDLSPYKHDGPGGEGAPEWVSAVTMPDPYRGPHREADAGSRYAEHVADAVRAIGERDRSLAAFLCEPLMGCGGQIVLPDGYLAEAYGHVRSAGGVCIADEVQIGFGRVGSQVWGFQTCGVVPDIVTLGKPIGNGHPLGAVVTTPEIARSFASGMEYFNTFGGNPVSCAVGMAVLDVLEDERLQDNARVVGERLLARLSELGGSFPLIGDVRGLGLFIGIELVLDPDSREPAPDHASYVAERMRDHGILLGVDGPRHNVLKIKPPLVFSTADADRVVETLGTVLAENPVHR